MGSSGGHRKLPGGSDDFCDTQTNRHCIIIYISPPPSLLSSLSYRHHWQDHWAAEWVDGAYIWVVSEHTKDFHGRLPIAQPPRQTDAKYWLVTDAHLDQLSITIIDGPKSIFCNLCNCFYKRCKPFLCEEVEPGWLWESSPEVWIRKEAG